MSQIAMTVLDKEGALHGEPHGSFTDRAVGALAADPETIAEFEVALARFPGDNWRHPLSGWLPGICEEPYDAGICIIDLAAKIVFLESTYSHASRRGSVWCRMGNDEFHLPFHVSNKWEFSQNVFGWRAESDARRRRMEPPIDAREILYGAVCSFLVDECLAVRSEHGPQGEWKPPGGWALRFLPKRLEEGGHPSNRDAVAEIHARWLMMSQARLRDRSPREILLADHDHIDFDLQDRCQQWSRTGECPLPLSRDSSAYRYAAFGTHEIVTYYEMVRYLAWECWNRVVQPPEENRGTEPDRSKEMRHLERARQHWLNSPDLEDGGGKTPAWIIENERRRIPWAVSGHDAMVDDDCPLCQMLAESPGPVFCHLDGCNMDDDFPFSWHLTREEWEEEQREWEEQDRRISDEIRAERGASKRSPWLQSGSHIDPETDSPLLILFGLACHVAELEQDLKNSSEAADLVGSVHHHFGNVRNVVEQQSSELVEPVFERFCEQLHLVAERCPDLDTKCGDLELKVHILADRVSEGRDDEELPF